jgi:hypothetical protein
MVIGRCDVTLSDLIAMLLASSGPMGIASERSLLWSRKTTTGEFVVESTPNEEISTGSNMGYIPFKKHESNKNIPQGGKKSEDCDY